MGLRERPVTGLSPFLVEDATSRLISVVAENQSPSCRPSGAAPSPSRQSGTDQWLGTGKPSLWTEHLPVTWCFHFLLKSCTNWASLTSTFSLESASELPGELIKTHVTRPHRSFCFRRSGVRPRICILTGSQLALWEPLQETLDQRP